MKRKKIYIAVCIVVFVIALIMTIYPIVSNYLAEQKQTKAYTDYSEKVQEYSNDTLTEEKQKAVSYNMKQLPAEDYENVLNIGVDGVMGYVKIPQIAVVLPIYHGTTSEVLEKGVGHLFGSSLPVGGIGTHCVLTGHSGMAQQKMFSDLDCLEKGNVFYIDILDETLEYRIEDIYVIDPNDTESLRVDTEKDMCSLITCTPFGVNTHRLVVKGIRTDRPENQVVSDVENVEMKVNKNSSTWYFEYLKAIFIGIVVVVGFIAFEFSIRFVKTVYGKNKATASSALKENRKKVNCNGT